MIEERIIKGVDGCERHPKCLTCPFDDCMLPERAVSTESRSEYNKRYYEEHKEHLRELNRLYYQKNREKIRARAKEKYRENPTYQKKANEKWAKTHREHKNRLRREYYQRTKNEKDKRDKRIRSNEAGDTSEDI